MCKGKVCEDTITVTFSLVRRVVRVRKVVRLEKRVMLEKLVRLEK